MSVIKHPDTYVCDICGAEFTERRPVNVPVVWTTEQTEGRFCEPYPQAGSKGGLAMAKYRKRPVEVEAFQILMGTMRKRDYPQWFADAIASGVVYQKANPDYPVECTIRTLEGEMDANLGDYIIKGVNGELYPCKPDIFDKTYERSQ